MASDPSEYDKSMPIVEAYLAKVERAVGVVRASHAGRPYTEVHQVLVAALQAEDAQLVAPQVIERYARQISEQLTS